ncbi:hypothetical protein BSL78_09814 [Apostichopus japonicus]|uniref:Uncharacterized protein n=1 Tax=Stichopus japonicus TaxID=307972 RepID=A0A2G8KZ43_STIJA|nr:hypothetical protein BSL78_09814 [Apostichopus japonicus]
MSTSQGCSSNNDEAVEKIKQRLYENSILADLCQVPLIFVMFAHMAHDRETQEFKFACGLDPDAGKKLINHLKSLPGGDTFAILCILEQTGDVNEIMDSVKDLCSRDVKIKRGDSALLQRSTTQLLEIASKNDIPISCLHLDYSSIKFEGDTIILHSGIPLPKLPTVEKIHIDGSNAQYGNTGTVTDKDILNLFHYGMKCGRIKELMFGQLQLPTSVSPEAFTDIMKTQNIQVRWRPFDIDFHLDLQNGHWEVDDNRMLENIRFSTVSIDGSVLQQRSNVQLLHVAHRHNLPISSLLFSKSFKTAENATIILNTGIRITNLPPLQKIRDVDNIGCNAITEQDIANILKCVMKGQHFNELCFEGWLMPVSLSSALTNWMLSLALNDMDHMFPEPHVPRNHMFPDMEGSGGLVGGQSPEERPGQLGSREPGKPGKAPAKKPKRPRAGSQEACRNPGGSQLDPERVAEVAVLARSRPLSLTREASQEAEPAKDHEWVAEVAVLAWSRPSSPTRGASQEAGPTQDLGRPEGPAPPEPERGETPRTWEPGRPGRMRLLSGDDPTEDREYRTSDVWPTGTDKMSGSRRVVPGVVHTQRWAPEPGSGETPGPVRPRVRRDPRGSAEARFHVGSRPPQSREPELQSTAGAPEMGSGGPGRRDSRGSPEPSPTPNPRAGSRRE